MNVRVSWRNGKQYAGYRIVKNTHVANTIRQSAIKSQYRRNIGPRVTAVFKGGPLAGMKVVVSQDEAKNEILGWCAMTDDGCVQVLYERDGAAWKYRGEDWGVR